MVRRTDSFNIQARIIKFDELKKAKARVASLAFLYYAGTSSSFPIPFLEVSL